MGGLDESLTEEQLRDDLSRFGLIDQVKIVRDKNIGFLGAFLEHIEKIGHEGEYIDP